MDRIDTLRLFVRIAETQSFWRAAESCGLSRASATERIAGLEQQLKVRLLNRSRRSVSLTPEGSEFLEVCRRVISELDQVTASLAKRTERASGQLRVSLNVAVGRCIIMPRLAEFASAHPDIQLEVIFADSRAEFVMDKIDVAIRIGGLEDQDLVVRRLGTTRRVTVAAPAYLAKFGHPSSPDDIVNHRTVDFLLPRINQRLEWEFGLDAEKREMQFSGRFAFNDGLARVEAAAAGLGIAQTLEFVARPFLSDGRLVRLFQHLESEAPPISILYAPTNRLPARTRAFIDFAASVVKDACDWPR
jgi:LysR family transcriptional regulator, regulator for bpeEF and oprC